MPTAIIDGIATRYEVMGSGPPLLMYSPAGFDATLDKWRTQGIYAKIKLLDHLPKQYTCIIFDRRETGQSGGRIERITWAHYVAQGKGLLDHLKIERAHIMGGCMGVPCAAAFGVDASADDAEPDPVLAGGRRQISAVEPPAFRHASRLRQRALARGRRRACKASRQILRRGSARRPLGGGDAPRPRLCRRLREAGRREYKLVVAGMARTLFDRDTAPGAEPEDLMRCDIPALIVPGRDAAHATSAARYLEECLPRRSTGTCRWPGRRRTQPMRGCWSFSTRLLQPAGSVHDHHAQPHDRAGARQG